MIALSLYSISVFILVIELFSSIYLTFLSLEVILLESLSLNIFICIKFLVNTVEIICCYFTFKLNFPDEDYLFM